MVTFVLLSIRLVIERRRLRAKKSKVVANASKQSTPFSGATSDEILAELEAEGLVSSGTVLYDQHSTDTDVNGHNQHQIVCETTDLGTSGDDHRYTTTYAAFEPLSVYECAGPTLGGTTYSWSSPGHSQPTYVTTTCGDGSDGTSQYLAVYPANGAEVTLPLLMPPSMTNMGTIGRSTLRRPKVHDHQLHHQHHLQQQQNHIQHQQQQHQLQQPIYSTNGLINATNANNGPSTVTCVDLTGNGHHHQTMASNVAGGNGINGGTIGVGVGHATLGGVGGHYSAQDQRTATDSHYF